LEFFLRAFGNSILHICLEALNGQKMISEDLRVMGNFFFKKVVRSFSTVEFLSQLSTQLGNNEVTIDFLLRTRS